VGFKGRKQRSGRSSPAETAVLRWVEGHDLRSAEVRVWAGRWADGMLVLVPRDAPTTQRPAVTSNDARVPSGPDRKHIEALLDEHRGNVSEVARALGVSRVHTYRYFRKLGIDPSRHRGWRGGR
jgi:transcriptional regulator with GAF, ATPase, and Fis domain